jgi:hypothetical protein
MVVKDVVTLHIMGMQIITDMHTQSITMVLLCGMHVYGIASHEFFLTRHS